MEGWESLKNVTAQAEEGLGQLAAEEQGTEVEHVSGKRLKKQVNTLQTVNPTVRQQSVLMRPEV